LIGGARRVAWTSTLGLTPGNSKGQTGGCWGCADAGFVGMALDSCWCEMISLQDNQQDNTGIKERRLPDDSQRAADICVLRQMASK